MVVRVGKRRQRAVGELRGNRRCGRRGAGNRNRIRGRWFEVEIGGGADAACNKYRNGERRERKAFSRCDFYNFFFDFGPRFSLVFFFNGRWCDKCRSFRPMHKRVANVFICPPFKNEAAVNDRV